MVTIRELTGALQHPILHQSSTHFTGLDHGPIEMLAGSANSIDLVVLLLLHI